MRARSASVNVPRYAGSRRNGTPSIVPTTISSAGCVIAILGFLFVGGPHPWRHLIDQYSAYRDNEGATLPRQTRTSMTDPDGIPAEHLSRLGLILYFDVNFVDDETPAALEL